MDASNISLILLILRNMSYAREYSLSERLLQRTEPQREISVKSSDEGGDCVHCVHFAATCRALGTGASADV